MKTTCVAPLHNTNKPCAPKPQQPNRTGCPYPTGSSLPGLLLSLFCWTGTVLSLATEQKAIAPPIRDEDSHTPSFRTTAAPPSLLPEASSQAPSHPRLPHRPTPPGQLLQALRDRISFGGDLTTVFQAAPGLDSKLGSPRDRAAVSFSVDLETLLQPWTNAVIYAHGEAGAGSGLDREIPTLSGINGDAMGEDATLTDFWFQQRFPTLGIAINVGKINLTGPGDYGPDIHAFDMNDLANNERTQFLAPALINNPTVPFPDPSAAVIVEWDAADWICASVGVADAVPDAELDLDWDDGLFWIGEVMFRPRIQGLSGHYRFYVWQADTSWPEIGEASKTLRNRGFGFSLDQQVHRWVGVFARMGWQRAAASEIDFAWSCGVVGELEGMGLSNQRVGVAVGQVCLSPEYERIAREEGARIGNETQLEAFYQIELWDHVQLSPDFQCIWNPGGRADVSSIWIVGMRVHVFY